MGGSGFFWWFWFFEVYCSFYLMCLEFGFQICRKRFFISLVWIIFHRTSIERKCNLLYNRSERVATKHELPLW